MVSVTRYFDDVFSYRMTLNKVKFGRSRMSNISLSQITNNILPCRTHTAKLSTEFSASKRTTDLERIHATGLPPNQGNQEKSGNFMFNQ